MGDWVCDENSSVNEKRKHSAKKRKLLKQSSFSLASSPNVFGNITNAKSNIYALIGEQQPNKPAIARNNGAELKHGLMDE
jgi:hypothetical protein